MIKKIKKKICYGGTRFSQKQFTTLKQMLSGSTEPVLIPSGVLTVHCIDCKWRHTSGCFCKDPEHVRDNWSCSEGEFAYK